MIDIYSFLPPETAEHNRKMQHEFSPLEQAVIIRLSDRPIEEKLLGYRMIAQKYPEYVYKKEVRRGDNSERQLEVHFLAAELERLVRNTKNALAAFKTGGEDIVYYVSCKNKFGSDPVLFRSFGAAMEHITAECAEDEGYYGAADWKMVKHCLSDGGAAKSVGSLRVTGSGIDCIFPEEDEGNYLEWFYVDVPLPFQAGDIVLYVSPYACERKPFVFTGSANDGSMEKYNKEHLKFGDFSDMTAYGIFANHYGGELIDEVDFPYTGLVRVSEDELTDEDKPLLWVSRYIKDMGKGPREYKMDLEALMDSVSAWRDACEVRDYLLPYKDSLTAPIKELLRSRLEE